MIFVPGGKQKKLFFALKRENGQKSAPLTKPSRRI
jgi:hypothetical protein